MSDLTGEGLLMLLWGIGAAIILVIFVMSMNFFVGDPSDDTSTGFIEDYGKALQTPMVNEPRE